MLKAREGRNLIRTGLPWLDICNKNLERAFSSDGMRYCCVGTRSLTVARPLFRCHSVVIGMLWFLATAATLIFSLSPQLRNAAVAASILVWRSYADVFLEP